MWAAGCTRTVVPPPPCNLRLVSGSRRWARAVQAAAAELGGVVSHCDARDAVVRLAGVAPRYSHLLLHPDSADGLLDELMKLTAGACEFGTEVLLLGRTRPPPRIGVIPAADRHAVRQALAPAAPGRPWDDKSMHQTELHEALSSATIELRYQPIVRIADRRPVALEALARLNHPIHGMLPPSAFVPQLEDAGLAAHLTDVVVGRALTDMASPLLRSHAFDISLNFPLDVLLVPEALRRLDAQRRAAGIPAERVVIELTESKPVEDLPLLAHVLERLRGDGYRVSIDDVSPSMNRIPDLLDLPFTGVKLDKDVVQAVHTAPAIRAFAQRIIDRARARQLSVVAEGVEDIATWQRMHALGVDLAQGFLVARPLPPAAVPIWLEAWWNQPAFG